MMANITVRNIPEELLNKLRTLSTLEKRSLNNEILAILEKGIARESNRNSWMTASQPKDTQLKVWENLCGRWKDKRQTDEIIRNVIGSRSMGREVDL
jgi:plasmid stability protein